MPYDNYQEIQDNEHGYGHASRERDANRAGSTTHKQETSTVATATASQDVRQSTTQINHQELHKTKHGGGNSTRQHVRTAPDLTHSSHIDAATVTHASKHGSHALNE
jgi:hypothetical protein